jgi:hypothetical protein
MLLQKYMKHHTLNVLTEEILLLYALRCHVIWPFKYMFFMHLFLHSCMK